MLHSQNINLKLLKNKIRFDKMKAKKMFNVLTYKIAKSIILPILFLWSIGTVFTLYQNQSVKKKLTKKQQECLNLKRNIGDLHSLYRGLSELEGKKIPIITLNTVNPNNNVVIKTSVKSYF